MAMIKPVISSPSYAAKDRNGGVRVKGQVSGQSSAKEMGWADRLTARIARDRPDVWERMKNGEFASVAEAARDAGIDVKNPKRAVLSEDIERLANRNRSAIWVGTRTAKTTVLRPVTGLPALSLGPPLGISLTSI